MNLDEKRFFRVGNFPDLIKKDNMWFEMIDKQFPTHELFAGDLFFSVSAVWGFEISNININVFISRNTNKLGEFHSRISQPYLYKKFSHSEINVSYGMLQCFYKRIWK